MVDTIINLNTTSGSQDMLENLEAVDPKAAGEIQTRGNKGDFLAMVQRPEDDRISRAIRKNWNKVTLF